MFGNAAECRRCHHPGLLKQPQLTGVVWTVLDERRELCKDVGSHVKGLFVQRAEVRIPAAKREESRGLGVKRLVSENKPLSEWLLITCLILFLSIPGRSQHLFQKLLDFDEVCFEGAVVEEERRIGAGGEVFELRWLSKE